MQEEERAIQRKTGKCVEDGENFSLGEIKGRETQHDLVN